MIVVIDYNVGNLKSVVSAFKRIGLDVIVSRDKEVISKAKAIILPGVGTFVVAMNNLKKYDLIDSLVDCKDKHIPILGICLGMQILFEKGYEVKVTDGLGFLKGEVRYLGGNQKIPHMGWNQIHKNKNHPILKKIEENDDVYFVHSYMAYASNDELIAYSDYGDLKISAIVGRDNIIGCQFHPEKSGKVGENILLAFKEMIGC